MSGGLTALQPEMLVCQCLTQIAMRIDHGAAESFPFQGEPFHETRRIFEVHAFQKVAAVETQIIQRDLGIFARKRLDENQIVYDHLRLGVVLKRISGGGEVGEVSPDAGEQDAQVAQAGGGIV